MNTAVHSVEEARRALSGQKFLSENINDNYYQ